MASSGSGVIVTIVGEDGTSKVLDQIEERMRRAATPAANLGKALGEGMEHSVPQVAAASAAIRLFEGQIPIRAVERLLTMVPGLGAALQVAFPVVGGIVFGEMVLESINKLRTMAKEATTAGARASEAFAAAHDKMRVTIDDLTITSSKLQDEIDKLSGHPSNGVQTALLEAKKAADELLVSLASDRKELESLMKEHSVSTLAGLFTGVAATGKQEEEIKADGEKLTGAVRTANIAYEQAFANANGDAAKIKAAGDVRAAAVRAAFQSQINAHVAESARLRKEEADAKIASDRIAATGLNPLAAVARRVDNSPRIQNEDALVQRLRERMQIEALNAQIGGQREKVGGLRQAKDQSAIDARAEEARRKLEEAQARLGDSLRKLQEAQADEGVRVAKAGTDEELAQLEASHKLKLVSDEDYFRQRLAVQERANASQLTADNVKRAALNTQIGTLQGQTFTGKDAGTDRLARDAKVNDLLVERLKISGQIASIEQDTAKKQIEAAADIAQAQSRVAEENYGRANEVLGAARSNVGFRQRSGAISSGDARTQNHALDSAQADQLQSVVDAYQRIVDSSSSDSTKADASAKIAALKEQILELRNPIDETATALRTGFDNAFEGLFENIGSGQKALESFLQSIQRTVMKQVYENVIAPQLKGVIDSMTGSVGGSIGRAKPASGVPAGVDLSSVVRPIVPGKVGGGILGDVLGDKGKVGITIVIQQDAQGNSQIADVLKSGNGSDQFEVNAANSFASGGFLRQMLGLAKGG